MRLGKRRGRRGVGLGRVLRARLPRTRRQRIIAGLCTVVFIAGLVIPLVNMRQDAQAWWNSSWTKRRKITFNNSASAENLTNFPVRISLTTSNIDYGSTLTGGADIRFVDQNDSTALSYEIEKWTNGGTSEVWVKVPQIDAASTNDHIWMYYGNTAATDGQNKAGVWDTAGHVGVWHNSETSGQVVDSTANITSSTATITGKGQTTNAKAGGAHDFEAGTFSDIVISPNTAALNVTSTYSVEAWIMLESWTSFQSIVSKGGGISPNFEIGVDSTDDIRLRYGAGGAGSTIITTSNTITTGTFHHVFVTLNASTNTGVIYINGVSRSLSGTVTADPVTNNSNIYMGNNGADQPFDGVIEEVRVMNSVKSADWAEASYISGNNAMTSFGSEESRAGGGGSGDWWDSCYQNRRKITIDNSDSTEDLVNFPLRVSLTGGTNIDYSKTKNAGEDIRFVDSDNATSLDYEIEVWNEGGGTGVSEVWVRVPQIDDLSTTDSIYMYYNCSSATDGQDPTGVWNSAFNGVWHLKEDPSVAGSLGILDSTSNNNDGTDNGSMPSGAQATGQIGGSLYLDGSNDYIEIPHSTSMKPTAAATLSVWAYVRNFNTAWQTFFNSTNSGGWGIDEHSPSGTLTSAFNVGGTYTNAGVSSTAMTPNQWYNFVATYDGTTHRIYINGAEVDNDTSRSGAITYSVNTSAHIGADAGSGTTPTGAYADATMDETRISSVARSAEWLEAEYLTGTNAMNTFGAEESPSGGPWWNTCYQNRRKITINNSASNEDLDNFPIRVSLVGGTNIDYSKTKNAGEDIRFTDDDNATELDYEIEVWNEGGGTGTSEVWVRVPRIDQDSITDAIYLYYNCSSATDGQDPNGVWNSGYKMVQHLEETAACATNFTDSTSNANTATCGGSPTNTTGKVGPARNFTAASSQYLNADNVADDVQTGGFSVSAWFKFTSTYTSGGGEQVLTALVSDTSINDFQFWFDNSDGTLNVCVYTSGASELCAPSTQTSWTAGTWYHVVGVMDTSTAPGRRIYINGSLSGTDSNTTRGATPYATNARIGDYDGTTSEYFNGAIDEVRYSNVVRSADWIEAEYLTSNNAMNTIGGEEDAPVPPSAPVLTDLTTDVSLTPTFQLRAADADNPTYLRYKIEVCDTSDCSSIVRTIDQTASQTGWSGQDAQTSTAYVASATLASSTMASHTYQSPSLSSGTVYYWRGYAIDPSDSNSWSAASAIDSFTTLIPPTPPAAPTLIDPTNGRTGLIRQPFFHLRATDANSNYLRYKIEICSNSDCSTVVRTIDQTSSQTGWSAQDAQSATAYIGSSVIGGSTVAVHRLQTPYLTAGSTYYWRAYAIDPSDTNTWSTASAINSFTVGTQEKWIGGGTTIRGGTTIY